MTPRSFTAALILGTLLLNGFVGAMLALMLYQSRLAAEETAQVSTATMTQVVEQNIAGTINKIDLALQTTIDEIQRQAGAGGMRIEALDTYVATLTARLPEVKGVRITDADGVVQYGNGTEAHVSLADRPFFQTQRDEPEAGLVFSAPLLGRVSHEWVLVETRRYTLPGPDGTPHFGGMIYGDLSIDRLDDLFAGLKVGPQGSVTLWDKDLKIVARYPEPTRGATIGQQIASEELTALVAAGKTEGSYHTRSRINVAERQLAFRKLAGYPFYVSVGEATEDYLAPWWNEVWRLGSIGLLFAVLSVLAARLLHRNWHQQKEAEAELRAARDEAEAATKAKSSFLAMMSHEIRTPMNGVMSMAEMLDQTELSDDQRSMSQIIRASAAALLTIINDILDFSKIEAGKLDIEAVPFSLLEVVEGAGELIAGRADEKGIGLTLDLDPSIPDRLIGDPTRIRQVLLNLLGNAVKFTAAGGVAVTVGRVAGERLRFAVTDTGIGLDAAQQAKLFQPFTQADASTARRFGGTGLGLSICQRLCVLMGGAIGVDSKPGSGSTFWFELPLGIADAALDRPAIAIADARIIALGFSGPGRAALAHLLAGAGIAAVEWLDAVPRDTPPSVVLIAADDGLAGFGALRDLVQDLGPAGAKPVLVAPRSLASTLDAAERAGFFATLTLPLRRHRLWHVIAAALGRAPLEQREAITSPLGRRRPPSLAEAHAAEAAILVAEDNRTNQIVIARLLSQLGYAHAIAGNGVEALALWQAAPFGLLLTDFHMPEMDGFELTRRIRAAEAQHRPIVALTADALPGTGQQCRDAGMDDYLTKPIDSAALAETLARLLPQATALRGPAGPDTRPNMLPEIDAKILDLKRLTEAFGGWDGEASAFLAGFLADAPRLVEAVSALAGADPTAARAAAHALKGAARSAGAVRLGQIASDVQDCLDGGDVETATILAELLAPTYAELLDAAAPLRAA